METYGRFLFEFLNQFFSGFIDIIKGFVSGIKNIFNIPQYSEIISQYKDELSVSEWILTAIAIIALVLIMGTIIGIIVMFLKKHMRFRKKLIEQEELLEEIDNESRNKGEY